MAVPRNKVTPSKRDQRRAHDAIRPVGYVDCPNCGEHKLSHHICSSCGHYRDREVIDTGDAL